MRDIVVATGPDGLVACSERGDRLMDTVIQWNDIREEYEAKGIWTLTLGGSEDVELPAPDGYVWVLPVGWMGTIRLELTKGESDQ